MNTETDLEKLEFERFRAEMAKALEGSVLANEPLQYESISLFAGSDLMFFVGPLIALVGVCLTVYSVFVM